MSPGRELHRMRSQRPRGSITRDAVIGAALALTDREGLEGLTIRGIAELGNAPPMSLYSHFKNKNELLDLMYAEIAGRMYHVAPQLTWQAELLAVARQVRSVLIEHPAWIPLLSRPSPPFAIPMRERVINAMVAAGVS